MALNPFSALAAKVYAGMFGAALALVTVQTVRIEGLWFIQGLAEELDTARANLMAEKSARKDDRAAWSKQVAAALATTAAAEMRSKEIATDAQASHDSLLAANAGLRDYIASHRLQSSSTSAAASPTAASDHAPSLSAPVTADAVVATSEADLYACDADYAYAAGAFEFGQQLIAKGLAK